MTARPHCFAASLATRCQRRARSRQRLGSRVTIVRSVVTGTTRATPSSVAARTIAANLSPFGTDWTSVIRSGDSASVRATPRTVPVTVSPTSSRRTVTSWPAPSAAITVSPALRRSTRARWRDSSRSNATRPSWIRSGAIVKRRTDELEGGPALHRDRGARSEAVAADRDLAAGRLRVQDAAEHERASGSDVAGVARRQPEVRRGPEVGHDERRRRVREGACVTEDAAHAIADPVAGRVSHGGGDGVGIVVDGENLTDAEPRRGDRERDDARLAGAGKAELAQSDEVLADTLLEGAGEGGLREEGAKPRGAAGRLLLDDAERAQLPHEVRHALGRLLGDLDGELPVAGGRHRLSRAASSCARGTLVPAVRARPSTRPRRRAAPRAAWR